MAATKDDSKDRAAMRKKYLAIGIVVLVLVVGAVWFFKRSGGGE